MKKINYPLDARLESLRTIIQNKRQDIDNYFWMWKKNFNAIIMGDSCFIKKETINNERQAKLWKRKKSYLNL